MLPTLAVTVLLAASPILLPQAQAKECDNYTNRELMARDSLDALDRKTNALIDVAAADANAARLGCDRGALFKALDQQLGATPFGVLEEWAQKTPAIERLQVNPDGPESIYHGFSVVHYPLLAISGIDNSIRLAGHVVGTDKLGHFMAEGLHTYKIWRSTGGSLEKAMRWGIHTEESYYGLAVSGVKSFGDLSANYAGAHFWDAILETDDPYFTCRDGRFVKRREFTWKDYVSDAWDEAVNCSQFTKSMAQTVRANFARKGGLTCPVEGTEQTCRQLVNLPDSQWYVSPVCWALWTRTGLTPAEADDELLVAAHKSGGENHGD